jgi:hypothetical protein
VLAHESNQVEIELDWPDDDAYRCFQSLGTLGLRVFVSVDDLADVVTRPTRIDFDDHSALLVAPGVRVWAHDGIQELDSTPWFGWGNGEFLVTTNAKVPTGKFFSPVRLDSLPSTTETGWRTSGVRMRFADGGSARAPVALVFARSPTNWSSAAVGNECLIVVGVQEPEDLFVHGDRFPDRPARWIVDVGASLTWPDGAPAGTAYHEHVLFDEPSDSGSRRCFVPTGALGWTLDGLRVCAERSFVREVDERD